MSHPAQNVLHYPWITAKEEIFVVFTYVAMETHGENEAMTESWQGVSSMGLPKFI